MRFLIAFPKLGAGRRASNLPSQGQTPSRQLGLLEEPSKNPPLGLQPPSCMDGGLSYAIFTR